MVSIIKYQDLKSNHKFPVAGEILRAGDWVGVYYNKERGVWVARLDAWNDDIVIYGAVMDDAEQGAPVKVVARWGDNIMVVVMGEFNTGKG